ncbi:nicotinate-nucleotide pyrophosphorylase [Candidatus Magnetoovum chiemensis]|nr:nicotinate-nucleotide pyrophosphorylase [Candidatus Magnetoovum chiemensis]
MEDKLLIVDDDPDVLLSLSDLLKDEGFDVKAVSSGEEALKVFSDFHPSVVITDMKMSGMSGLELIHKLRKINSYVQIVILTGYASVKNVAEAMANNGAFAYFQKPLSDFEMFFGSIRQAFEKERLIRENYHWEERLKLANARFETIFENMDAVIYVSDMDTYELLYANSTFKELFGDYSEENKKKNNITKGKKCWEVLQKANSGPCSFCTNPKLVDVNGKPLNPYTWEFYNPVVRRWFSIKDQAIYWHNGRVVRLETAMDITPYYKLSREVEKSKRFKAIGVLAGGIAHDLNNTLAAILGNINLAQLIASDPESDEYFVAAENGIMQAKTLSGKLLALAKGDTPVKKIVDMKELLINFISENKFGSTIELTVLDNDSNCEEIDKDDASNFIIEVRKWIDVLSLIPNNNTKILDTRKTLPGWRQLQKYAVKCGGGNNHRMGLYDMVMIKDNHIDSIGSITKAVEVIRSKWGERFKIEVETRNIREVQEALDADVDIIMLDNMDIDTMKEAVRLINKRAKSEASGNMNLERLKAVAETGVDYISVGALTHSVTVFDFSLRKDVA